MRLIRVALHCIEFDPFIVYFLEFERTLTSTFCRPTGQFVFASFLPVFQTTMRKYRLVSKKGEGTFSEVLKAQNVKRGDYHAIKCMRNHFESIEQVNTLREIQALRRLQPHPHIITLEEVLYDQPTGRLALVFELMDQNLYEVIRGRRHYLSPQLIKIYIYQLLKGLEHMHKRGIFHRDIKPENILVNHNCDFDKGLKLADFGSCRGIYSKQPYTEYISTRWYRAPECLLTDGYYGPEMDLWGVGCVFFEITSLYPLFPGTNELDQINRVHQILGTPPEKTMQKFKSKGAAHLDFNYPSVKGTGIAKLIPHAQPEAVDLMQKLLAYDPDDRITAKDSLKAPYFADLHKMEANLKRRKNRGSKSSNDSKGAADGGGSPDLDRSGGNRLKSDRSNQSLRNAEKENSKSSAKNSGNNDSGNNSSSNNSNSKAGGSLPSISSNAGGRLSDLSGNRNAPNTDSPLPPIIANTKNSDSSKNDHDSSSSSKVTQSHSTSNLSSKTYGNSSSHRGNQRSKKPSQPSKSSNYSTGGSTNREKRRHKQSKYGAYGSSMYKSKSKHRSSGNSGVGGSSLGGGVYGSSGGGTNFSVLGQGHKAQLKAYKSSKGRSKRGRGSSLQPQWASKKY